MNPANIGTLVERWADIKFECVGKNDSEKFWEGAYFYEEIFGGVSLPRDWIEADKTARYVSLKDTPVYGVVGPDR